MLLSAFRKNHLAAILDQYSQQSHPLDLFISQYLRQNKSIGSKDRNLIVETAYQLVRWKGLLDYLCPAPATLDKRLEIYAAHFSRDRECDGQQLPPHVEVSFPLDLFNLLTERLGFEQAHRFCTISNQSAPIAVRVNTLKIAPIDLLRQLQRAGYGVRPCETAPEGLIFEKRESFSSIDAFKQGFFEIQDENSQNVARCVAIAPKEHVLDFCAGAGGKALSVAARMQNTGQIYLHDVRPRALEQAKQRLKRAGVQNFQLLPAGSPQLAKIRRKMDWVIADVPCSGTGTLRRNPDMKWRFERAQLDFLQQQQREIFARALEFIRPQGGKIVYMTCSVLPDENELQMEYFIKKHRLKLVGSPVKFLPATGGGDGFFAVVLQPVNV